MEMIPAAPSTGATSGKQTVSITRERIPTKQELCLTLLIERGDQGINKLEALSLYGETCLPTTISELANDHRLEFVKVREPHQHKGGGKTFFTRYSLVPEGMEYAHRLLTRFRSGGKS